MSATKGLPVLPGGEGPLSPGRRAFLRTAAAGAAVSALASCGVSMEDFLRKHFKQLSKDELARVLARAGTQVGHRALSRVHRHPLDALASRHGRGDAPVRRNTPDMPSVDIVLVRRVDQALAVQ